MKTYDYAFFDRSVGTVRNFIGRHPYALERGSKETGTEQQLKKSPKIVVDADELGKDCLFLAASYATSPGHGLAKVQKMVGHPLPEDFLGFYERYEKALVVSRTFPIHLWHEEKIIEGIHDYCAYSDRPFRLLRFGDQYEMGAVQFALWLETPGTMNWRVVATQSGSSYLDDTVLDPDEIIGPSFYEWLKDWIERDGLPDGFMDLGPEGGLMDPPTEQDLARVAARQRRG